MDGRVWVNFGSGKLRGRAGGAHKWVGGCSAKGKEGAACLPTAQGILPRLGNVVQQHNKYGLLCTLYVATSLAKSRVNLFTVIGRQKMSLFFVKNIQFSLKC